MQLPEIIASKTSKARNVPDTAAFALICHTYTMMETRKPGIRNRIGKA